MILCKQQQIKQSNLCKNKYQQQPTQNPQIPIFIILKITNTPMRPKVSRGIKTTQSTKNLAILGSNKTKQSLPFQIQELNLHKLTHSKKDHPSAINTCRTEFSSKNYASKTNQTDREKKPLESIYQNQYQNRKTYKEIQREKNGTRNSYMSRNNSRSKLYLEDQENRYKPIEKQYEEISTIDIEILQILEQQNIECKETISKLKKQNEQKELSIEFFKKTNDDLEMKLFHTEKELMRVEELSRKREEEIYLKNSELQTAMKEIEELRLELELENDTTLLKDPQQQTSQNPNSQTIFQELNRLRDNNEILIRQQQSYKTDLRNIRKQNVGYRRQIARLKRELIDKEENWIEIGERSSIKIAEGIRLELKEFGDERNKQYEEMLRHYREEIDFLRSRNSMLESKLQGVKEKQIKELICLKRSFDDARGKGRGEKERERERERERGESVRQVRTHVKSRSMAMLSHLGLKTEQDSY